MFSFSPEIGFALISGACALVFCFLVVCIKSRKETRSSSAASNASLHETERVSGRKLRDTNAVHPATISKRPSGILMCAATPDTSSKQDLQAGTKLVERRAPRQEFHIPQPVTHESIPAAASSDEEKVESAAPGKLPDWQNTEVESQIPESPALDEVNSGEIRSSKLAKTVQPDSSSKVTSIAKFKKAASPQPENQDSGSEERRLEKGVGEILAKISADSKGPTSSAGFLKFYGLRQQPFDVTPDPAFLYSSPSHREALTTLKQGIEHFRGFMMLVAEPGMGKTMLLNRLMEELSESARVVFLFQTQYNSAQLLGFILDELEVNHEGMDVVAMHRALNQSLLEEMLRGQRFVLIVDEAQNLQPQVLETIRLLSDFETTHSKLIQIILAGQPKLADTLMHAGLNQLRQRIATVSQLKRFTSRETVEYIEHRMRAAGWSHPNIPFTRDALTLIAQLGDGIPRTINNLCFNALFESYQYGEQIPDANMVRQAAEKMNLGPQVRKLREDSALRASQSKSSTPAARNSRAR